MKSSKINDIENQWFYWHNHMYIYIYVCVCVHIYIYILIDHPKNQFMLISPTWLPAKSQSQQITNEKKAASGKIIPNHGVNDNGGHIYLSHGMPWPAEI